jgi:uncharacterized membrane protein
MMSQSRFENFSDGLIAIVITLLAFELTIPALSSNDLTLSLSALIKTLPHLALYFLSFITIAIMWENHHVISSRIERINQKIFWSNSFLLMFMALVPFATSFLGNNPVNKIAMMFYCFIMLCISLSFSQFRKNVYRSVSKGDEKLKAPRHVGVYLYTFAIFTTFFSVPLAYLLLCIPLIFYMFPQQMGK